MNTAEHRQYQATHHKTKDIVISHDNVPNRIQYHTPQHAPLISQPWQSVHCGSFSGRACSQSTWFCNTNGMRGPRLQVCDAFPHVSAQAAAWVYITGVSSTRRSLTCIRTSTTSSKVLPAAGFAAVIKHRAYFKLLQYVRSFAGPLPDELCATDGCQLQASGCVVC